jgi:hypothetical protein
MDKMKLVESLWVKPFSTGMSCIDTIDGECLRGLSLEECMQRCEDSPYCHAGYHVSFTDRDLSSFCLPLNTISYQNTNFLNSVIQPTNSTRLSADNGIHVNVFYDEDRFPDTLDVAETSFLFLGDTCFLCVDMKEKGPWYLQQDFSFSQAQDTALSLVLGLADMQFVMRDIRMSTKTSIVFFQSGSPSVLGIQDNMWTWRPYQIRAKTFDFDFASLHHSSSFLNQEDRFHLVSDDKFIGIAGNRLVEQSRRPDYFFFFVLDHNNTTNRISRLKWNTRPFSPLFNQKDFILSMEDFLCQHFKACHSRTQTVVKRPRVMMLTLIVIGVWILCVIVFVVIQISKRCTS